MNAEIQTAARNNIQRCEMLQIAPVESCSDLRETLCDSRRKWREIVEYMANKERNSGPFQVGNGRSRSSVQ